MNDENFMLGWRMWSFDITRTGKVLNTCIKYSDVELVKKCKKTGRIASLESKEKWNQFRSNMLEIFSDVSPKLHFHDQYRLIFKRVAFVVVDCCFAVKYRCDVKGLHELLTEMFKQTGTDEMPTHFVILDNHTMDSELDYKINQVHRLQYRNTQRGVDEYRSFEPSLSRDRLQKVYVPFAMSHCAMYKSEKKAHDTNQQNSVDSRARLNDYAQVFLMNHLRKSFGLCARVALLSEDNMLINTASTFAVDPATVVRDDLPSDYTDSYIVSPALLQWSYWDSWRSEHVHPEFAEQFSG